ncbi:MAG: NUDIX hydrolase [Candidatus Paceibacteria bacterium]
MDKTFEIRCRGIIIDRGELLVVEHVGKEGFLALPGGHLEWGEDIKAGLVRELEEELGITPIVGALLYIHNFTQDNSKHVVEFLFWIDNAADFRNRGQSPTHAHELATVNWVNMHDTRIMRPVGVWSDFTAGKLGQIDLQYLVNDATK